MNKGTKLVGIGVIVLGVALAQQSPTKDSEKSKPAASSEAAAGPQGSKSTVPEAKTRAFKGTLVAASCAGGSGETKEASSKAAKQPAGEASRSTEAGSQSCGLSSGVSEFALKTTDGRTLPFDLVGNERAQEAIKSNKKWESAASSGKPIQTKVHGTEDGGKLTVISIQ